MTQAEIVDVASAEIPSTKQRLFMRYFTAILVDLVVLNLFAQYWERVVIDAFSVSLVAAIVLQVLLKITLNLEHRVAEWFNRLLGVGRGDGPVPGDAAARDRHRTAVRGAVGSDVGLREGLPAVDGCRWRADSAWSGSRSVRGRRARRFLIS